MQRSDDEFLEFDKIDEPEITGEDFADLSNEEIERIERAATALTRYESAVAERERAATDRESAQAKRVIFERIGKRYIPFAIFLLSGFPAFVYGVTQILQYTDIRLWIGSSLLALGLLTAIGLLAAANQDQISNLFDR
ncbi:hypothetical protein C482_00145 [Natrialba chahannaoensis JCM 10990]|uniref:Uncharacterized protein n=1 Tax=Natrialba chahannaoensis JCM 10990 TaxID=1227492 RepID=M0B5U6_9EURY|nr:hypothetical protein [Natrialba chahannaoensis]ELZ06185.1 hypothetical protein C482_00145 [Natrialba chahannaoensis JCM 10990]